MSDDSDWRDDAVRTRTGAVVPVRETARRLTWPELPAGVRAVIERRAGCAVVSAVSSGTGFTPGLASRLGLADGGSVFLKAASASLDARVGWTLTASYREEIRKLRLLPSEVPAPRLLWSIDAEIDGEIDGEAWVVLALEAVDGRPPRRPWRPDELTRVCDALTAMAPTLAAPSAQLELTSLAEDWLELPTWLTHAERRDGPSRWLDVVGGLAAEAAERCAGTGLAHLDLRDDNILIDPRGKVWICDWNWPLAGAPWLDLVTVLISAAGDGLDVDAELTRHPLTADVDPRSVDSWLAALWLYFTTAQDAAVPPHSPHLRDHQRWYADAIHDWLGERLDRGAARRRQP